VKVSREGVGDMVGEACDVVESWYISVVPLVNAEQPEEVRRGGVRGGAALALPERGVEVIAFADDSPFTGVKGLGDGFEVNEAAGELEVRVGDGAIWIFSGDEEARDVVWPFDAP